MPAFRNGAERRRKHASECWFKPLISCARVSSTSTRGSFSKQGKDMEIEAEARRLPKPSISANITLVKWHASAGPQCGGADAGRGAMSSGTWRLGVGIVIPPWNFSLAILCGMAVAALVTGNTVVIKPSSETPTVGAIFADLLLEAGFPPESFSYLPGSGAAVGDVLVQHPKNPVCLFHRFTRCRSAHQRARSTPTERPDLD